MLTTRHLPNAPVAIVAQGETLLLGEDFLPWMVLAFGAAMVVGNLFALLRPPGAATTARPPLGRAVALIVIGGVAALWGIASLIG